MPEYIVGITSEGNFIASYYLLPKWAFAEVTHVIIGKDNKLYLFLREHEES